MIWLGMGCQARSATPRSLAASQEAKRGVEDAPGDTIQAAARDGTRERVVGVELVEQAGGQVVGVEVARPKRRRMFSSGCGQRIAAAYDRRVVAWRHLDVFRVRRVVRCEIRRVACPECGVRGELVPWARAGSRFTRASEDTCV